MTPLGPIDLSVYVEERCASGDDPTALNPRARRRRRALLARAARDIRTFAHVDQYLGTRNAQAGIERPGRRSR